jgi:hypothetical protein
MGSEATLTDQRILKTRAEAEYVALKNRILRGDHLHREKLETALMEVTLAIRQIIESSKLTAEEKNEIYQNLAQIPVTIEYVRKDQTRALAKGEIKPGNGDSSQD